MNSIYIRGMWGLGDNCFQRPFTEELLRRNPEDEVYVDTPWPELYEDLGPKLKFVHSHRNLRTQTKNQSRQPQGRWSPPPAQCRMIHVMYGHHRPNICESMANCFGMPSYVPKLSLPPTPPWPRRNDKPIAMIRPVSIRTEWNAAARNPLPEYVEHCAQRLSHTHHVVAVADLAPGQENLVGNLPFHHEGYLRGELNAIQLMSLTKACDLIIGGVGWIVPFALAADVESFILLGGLLGHNAPAKITPNNQHGKLWFAWPDHPCHCTLMRHQCSKQIRDLSNVFEAFLKAHTSRGTVLLASAS